MARGDHVRVRHFHKLGGAYWHHGVDVGSRQVVSNTPDRGISLESVEQFSVGMVHAVQVTVYRPHVPLYSKEEAAQRALSAVGTQHCYRLTQWNCEHFANACCTKLWNSGSEQVAEAGAAFGRIGFLQGLCSLIYPPLGLFSMAMAGAGLVLSLRAGAAGLYDGWVPYLLT